MRKQLGDIVQGIKKTRWRIMEAHSFQESHRTKSISEWGGILFEVFIFMMIKSHTCMYM